MAERLPSTCEALVWMPSTENEREKKCKRGHGRSNYLVVWVLGSEARWQAVNMHVTPCNDLT